MIWMPPHPPCENRNCQQAAECGMSCALGGGCKSAHHWNPVPTSRKSPAQLLGPGKINLIAAGSVLGALGASTCCILPLLLFSLGISGAWIGQLTALSDYQPFFIAVTVSCLAYGYWLVFRKTERAYEDSVACGRGLSGRLVKFILWIATALVALALAWPFVVTLILDR